MVFTSASYARSLLRSASSRRAASASSRWSSATRSSSRCPSRSLIARVYDFFEHPVSTAASSERIMQASERLRQLHAQGVDQLLDPFTSTAFEEVVAAEVEAGAPLVPVCAEAPRRRRTPLRRAEA